MSDQRLSKQTVTSRKSRASQDRQVTEDRVSMDADRLEMFRASFEQAVLPNIPPIPGYHPVWLSANNSRDSLAMRHRLGYEPVTEEDVKGFEFTSDKGETSDGLIHVNEMVAYKLPLELYQLYMSENHHYKPNIQESKLTDAVDAAKQEAVRLGGRVDPGPGVEALREHEAVEVPDFTDVG